MHVKVCHRLKALTVKVIRLYQQCYIAAFAVKVFTMCHVQETAHLM